MVDKRGITIVGDIVVHDSRVVQVYFGYSIEIIIEIDYSTKVPIFVIVVIVPETNEHDCGFPVKQTSKELVINQRQLMVDFQKNVVVMGVVTGIVV